jgi:Fe2+ or Zn2+ uptake regulation protein
MQIDEIMQLIREKGFKSTVYRKMLLELLIREHRPLSVGEMLEFFSQKKMEPNKTTLYREVYFLIDQGILKELDLGDDRKRYELSHLDHHHHLICEKCNSIEDVVIDEDLKTIEKNILVRNSFKVTDHTLEFFGLCKKCK